VAERDPRAALERFRQSPADWDLVITDHTMPHMTGVDLARQLLALRPALPVILCTGYTEAIGPEGARALGIREYLMKPVSAAQLAQAVARALGSRDAPS